MPPLSTCPSSSDEVMWYNQSLLRCPISRDSGYSHDDIQVGEVYFLQESRNKRTPSPLCYNDSSGRAATSRLLAGRLFSLCGQGYFCLSLHIAGRKTSKTCHENVPTGKCRSTKSFPWLNPTGQKMKAGWVLCPCSICKWCYPFNMTLIYCEISDRVIIYGWIELPSCLPGHIYWIEIQIRQASSETGHGNGDEFENNRFLLCFEENRGLPYTCILGNREVQFPIKGQWQACPTNLLPQATSQ